VGWVASINFQVKLEQTFGGPRQCVGGRKMASFVPIWNTVVVMNAWKVIKVDELIMNKLAHCVIMGENASFILWECSRAQCAWEVHTRKCNEYCFILFYWGFSTCEFALSPFLSNLKMITLSLKMINLFLSDHRVVRTLKWTICS
jgi:hypothetical protein